MNKLDEFAMAALGGLIAQGEINNPARLAGDAYRIAEAMLKESNRRGQSELQNTLEKK